MDLNTNDAMLDMYLFETNQNIEQLESCILDSERTGEFSDASINEIFRIMHTIKGSSAMMLYHNISTLAHSMEDLFYFIREQKPKSLDCTMLSSLIFDGIDFIKVELHKIKSSANVDGDATTLIEQIKGYLIQLKGEEANVAIEKPPSTQQQQYYIAADVSSVSKHKNSYKAVIYFEDGCEMENIRAYTVIHNLHDIATNISYQPEDIIENDESINQIREQGFQVYFQSDKSYEEVRNSLNQVIFLKECTLEAIDTPDDLPPVEKSNKIVIESSPIIIPKLKTQEAKEHMEKDISINSVGQSMISVNVNKLDQLMDLVGEMVIAEAMVTQNPELKGLPLENFQKAARQLHKITSEMQDMVMSIRMVPLSTTFHKMHRIVRDMCKKLDKEVKLELIGEETEVDKNIIEHIADPLMHLVRNSIDHGIEASCDREACGKDKVGKITLEAKNSGSDVLIIVRDDGKGLNKEKIIKRAIENNLIQNPEQELSDQEVYSLILLPGFSTKDQVTEFSGRGVGMDVVTQNLEAVGGVVLVDSVEGKGSTMTLKIPLTLAIIDGMNIQVGHSRYTIPITTIKESFRPKDSDIICDPDGNEMIMMRGQCYPILRLHEAFGVETDIIEFTEGIFIMVEQDKKTFCIFADQLLGQQQVVVKSLPSYIKSTKNIRGLSGCTLLGDGSISLILNIGELKMSVSKN